MDYLEYLSPGCTSRPLPDWPPDAFALAAASLKRSSSYLKVVMGWPPGDAPNWIGLTRDLGRAWRESAGQRTDPPEPLRDAWKVATSAEDVAQEVPGKNVRLTEALLLILAAADEACDGMVLPSAEPEQEDPFLERVLRALSRRNLGTITEDVDPTRIAVLPKIRSPTTGMTIRSLSRNLALCEGSEVRSVWAPDHGWNLAPEAPGNSLKLLLLPWPEVVEARDFEEVQGSLSNLPKQFGFFRFEQAPRKDRWVTSAGEVFGRAREMVGDIHGIVFPELALHGTEARRIAKNTGAFVVGGVHAEGHNSAAIEFASAKVSEPFDGRDIAMVQPKHHRWRFNGDQVRRYDLQDRLDPERDWWESHELTERSLTFWSPAPDLTACVLICEDLARPDPAADVVRAVAPQLVISLLLDGPQLVSRWPARHATVLADDPGSSVLTLTSLGMALRSNPPGTSPSRAIGLWKDPLSGAASELQLPPGHSGLILILGREHRPGWTADGRVDPGDSPILVLRGAVPVPH